MIESHPHGAAVPLPEPLVRLRELALNLRWTWDREARALFRQIYPDLWDRIVDNPWMVLRAAAPHRLETLARDPDFIARLDREYAEMQRYMAERGWFHQAYPEEGEALTAYFTAECGLTECLPIYAGGLGILSGDHLKAASALGVPLVGVTLLYQEGYARQALDASGWQLDRFPANSFETMPLRVERDAEGWPLIVEAPLPGRPLSLMVWRAQVGRVTLYLLDSNIPTNSPSDRGITSQLYGGDREMRLQQEMALGIGGWRALTKIGLRPQVCHLNEGHAAFAVLERARSLMAEGSAQLPVPGAQSEPGTGHQAPGTCRCSFREALVATAAGNVFTTHTPVSAGFDLFAPDLAWRYLTPYAAELGISVHELIGLGRADPGNNGEPFNMAVLALRHVNSCNGVSRLHAEVSRRLFRPWFPRVPDREMPVAAVTNGIHTDSWLAECPELTLFKPYVAPDADEFPDRVDWERAAAIPDDAIWACMRHQRQRLVDFARERLQRQMGQRGGSSQEAAERAGQVLDPDVLTIGFARRFAAYKRPTLFLRDPERLRRLLLDPERPVQFVVAGKAHPNDDEGKRLLQQVFQFAQGEEVRRRVVFLEDYDMRVTGRLVQGVDVWLNTPRRPMEASGTSGMKVLANTGLNLSIRDGWWAEAYEPGVGWAFGVEQDGLPPEEQDAIDAGQLYETLEREVIPLFYDRGPDGVPHGWIAMVKNSMRRLCPRFNTNRMVREYVEQQYLPAARRYRTLIADDLARAKSLAAWDASVRARWSEIRIEETARQESDGALHFRARVRLGGLKPEEVAGQVYAEPLDGGAPEIAPMTVRPSDDGAAWYEGQVPARRAADQYTIRLLPHHPDAQWPLGETLILWER